MKIAICTNHYAPSIGGCETVTRKIAESLSDHDVYIFTRKIPGRNKDLFNYEIIEYNYQDSQNSLQKLNHIAPDLIFIYSDVFDFLRQIIKNCNKSRIIIALCGANYLYSHRNYSLIFYRQSFNVERFICHSVFDRDYKFCSVPTLKAKTIIIPNGVDLKEFDKKGLTKGELGEKYGVDADNKWLLNIGNFFPGKGQNHLIDIIKSLSHPNLEYLQISNDIDFPIGKKLEDEWKSKVKHYNLSNAHLLKNLPRTNILDFLKSSSLFITASYKEVAPLVILESMAAGIPWISFDVGNVRGLHGGRFITCRKNNQYQCIISTREISLFQQNISDLLLSTSLGKLGRKQIETEMTWDAILPKYKMIFER